MTRDAFETLLTRRDELVRAHTSACDVLAEEPSIIQHQRCVRLYDEVKALQEQIDRALENEQGRDG